MKEYLCTMSEVKVRKVMLADIEMLQEIGRITFFESFFEFNTPEDMALYLKDDFSIEKFSNEISTVGSEFEFAIIDNVVVGYLKTNIGNAQMDLQHENALEIQRIYVKKEFHGCGVGQLLFDKAFEKALDKNVEFIWLGVWEQNPRAIRFYEKNGFVFFGKHPFMLGNDFQEDILMKRKM